MGFYLDSAVTPAGRTRKTATPLSARVGSGLRYFSPTLGLWLSRDPIEERGGVHLYGFVVNDPISSVDPCGLSASTTVPPSDDYLPPSTGVLIGQNVNGWNIQLGVESLILHKDFVKKLLECECFAWQLRQPSPMAGAKKKSGFASQTRLLLIEAAAKVAIGLNIQRMGPYPIEGSVGCKDGQKCVKDTLLASGDLIVLGITDVEEVFVVIELTFGVRAPFSAWDGHCQ